MYKTRLPDGRLNICGIKVKRLRMAMDPKCSQRALADKLQLQGMDVDKNAIQRLESGERFVTDIELRIIAQVLGVTTDELLSE